MTIYCIHCHDQAVYTNAKFKREARKYKLEGSVTVSDFFYFRHSV